MYVFNHILQRITKDITLVNFHNWHLPSFFVIKFSVVYAGVTDIIVGGGGHRQGRDFLGDGFPADLVDDLQVIHDILLIQGVIELRCQRQGHFCTDFSLTLANDKDFFSCH